jgi:acetone carboxylase gamma subunit
VEQVNSCPECAKGLVEDTDEMVEPGYSSGDPDAPVMTVDILRCPDCGYCVEVDAMLTPFIPKHGRPAPSEDEFDVFAEVSA